MVDELVKGFKIELPPASSSLMGPVAPRLSSYLPVDCRSIGETAWDEKRGVVASSGHGKRIVSFVPPTAGVSRTLSPEPSCTLLAR